MIKINEVYCKGCNLCIEFCPKKVLQPSKKLNLKGVRIPVEAKPKECTKCRMCEVICPDSAIYVVEK